MQAPDSSSGVSDEEDPLHLSRILTHEQVLFLTTALSYLIRTYPLRAVYVSATGLGRVHIKVLGAPCLHPQETAGSNEHTPLLGALGNHPTTHPSSKTVPE